MIVIEIDGDRLEIKGASSEDTHQLVEMFVQRHGRG
jgi:hypothetical protein